MFLYPLAKKVKRTEIMTFTFKQYKAQRAATQVTTRSSHQVNHTTKYLVMHAILEYLRFTSSSYKSVTLPLARKLSNEPYIKENPRFEFVI